MVLVPDEADTQKQAKKADAAPAPEAAAPAPEAEAKAEETPKPKKKKVCIYWDVGFCVYYSIYYLMCCFDVLVCFADLLSFLAFCLSFLSVLELEHLLYIFVILQHLYEVI